jgi:uncharacterized protein YaeQ
MALNATVYPLEIALADSDRHVYETLALRVARHPSESADYMWARVLAYCLEYTEGIAFGRGLSDPDAPAIAVRDLTGVLQAWIDVGVPEAARVHKAAKAAPRVAIYTHKDPAQLLRVLGGTRIHNAAALALYALDRPLIAALAQRLERRMSLAVAVTGGELYVTLAGVQEPLTGSVRRLSLADSA